MGDKSIKKNDKKKKKAKKTVPAATATIVSSVRKPEDQNQ